MPTTVNFALPYPGALDEPCDFAQDWCAFTDAAQVVLSKFQTTADRVFPVQPVAKMEITTNTTIVKNSFVPFDTLTFDNAGYIDFDVSNTTMTVTRAGRFIVVFNAFMATTGVANSRFLIDLGFVPTSEDQSQELDRATASVAFSLTAYYSSVLAPFDVNVILDTDAAAATNLTIERAALSLWWHADGAAP
jgi:hypothetical protein